MARRRIKVTVRDTDRGWRKLAREVFGFDRHVTVGVHGEQDARKHGGLGNVAIMAINEFGSVAANIPERSVIRHTIDNELPKYRRLLKALGGKIYATEITVKQALEILGAKVAADMRRTIARTPGQWPALQPATLARRDHGGTRPLLDRAELQRSIKHKVFA